MHKKDYCDRCDNCEGEYELIDIQCINGKVFLCKSCCSDLLKQTVEGNCREYVAQFHKGDKNEK